MSLTSSLHSRQTLAAAAAQPAKTAAEEAVGSLDDTGKSGREEEVEGKEEEIL